MKKKASSHIPAITPAAPGMAPERSSNTSDRLFKRLFYASLIAMLGILWITGYRSGVCYDELTLNVYGKDNIAFYTSGGKDTSFMHPEFSDMDGAGTFHNTLRYYGSIFEYMSIGLNYLLGNVHDGYEYTSSHMLNQLIAIVGILFTGLLIRRITGRYRSAFIAALLLYLTPIISGLSIFDTKDIPFMTGYVATLYFMSLFLEALPRPGWKTATGLMLSLFFTFGIRVGAILLVMYIPLFLLVYGLRSRNAAHTLIKDFRFWFPKITVALAGALLLTVAAWPFLLLDPVHHFLAAVNVVRNFPQRIPVTFDGRLMDSFHIPKSYLPRMMLMTIPALILVCIGGSFLLLIFRHRSFHRKLLLLVFFSSVFPIVYACYTHAPLYNSWRHFLFVYPGLVIIAAVGIDYVMERANPLYKWVVAGLLLLCMISPISWIIRTTPYQYVYFNEFTGGFANVFHDYEKDYYFISVKDAIDWVIRNEPVKDSRDTVIIASNSVAFAHYYIKRCYPGLKIKVIETGIKGRNVLKWDYALLGNFYLDPQLEEHYFPPAQTIHTIDIDGMPVNAILKDQHHYGSGGLEAMSRNDFVTSDSLFNLYLREVQYAPGVPIDLGGLSGNIAYTKMVRQEIREALFFAQNDILFNPRSYLGYLVSGIVEGMQGNLKAAKYNLTIATELNPRDIIARQYLSRMP